MFKVTYCGNEILFSFFILLLQPVIKIIAVNNRAVFNLDIYFIIIIYK
ncbi:hypothetical protein RPAAT24_0904 [Rickettsia parkeri str. AT|nr:hypothetical protein RPAAT24_0904 [Rickettsia parkeri str. AT\